MNSKPDWNLWKYMREVQLQLAVMLSLDIDIGMDIEELPWYAEIYQDPEFVRRLTIALNHVDAGELQVVKACQGWPKESTVRLDTFGAWAAKLNMSLPDQFPRLSDADPTPGEPPLDGEQESWNQRAARVQRMVDQARADGVEAPVTTVAARLGVTTEGLRKMRIPKAPAPPAAGVANSVFDLGKKSKRKR